MIFFWSFPENQTRRSNWILALVIRMICK